MSATPDELARLRERVEGWLATVAQAEALPEGLAPEGELADVPPPDLLSITAALTALTQEVRLSSRAFSKVEEALATSNEERERRALDERRTKAALHALSQDVQQAARREGRRDALHLVFEMLDRLERHATALRATSPRGLFRHRAKQRHAALIEGVALILRSTRDELGRSGVVAIGEVGEAFDPQAMQAVRRETVADEAQDGRVIEVLRQGWRQGDELYRLAEVVVGRA